MKRRWHLVAYDVRDDKRLRKVAKILQGYGLRLQYSVFRCLLSDRDAERMRWDLARVMDKKDGLLIVSLCHTCVQQLRSRSPSSAWTEEPPAYEIIGGEESSTGG